MLPQWRTLPSAFMSKSSMKSQQWGFPVRSPILRSARIRPVQGTSCFQAILTLIMRLSSAFSNSSASTWDFICRIALSRLLPALKLLTFFRMKRAIPLLLSATRLFQTSFLSTSARKFSTPERATSVCSERASSATVSAATVSATAR